MDIINIKEKFDKISDYFNPGIIAELNGQHIKLAKIKGEFIWHSHKDEDEFFFVIKGKLFIDFRDKTIVLNEGEMVVVPKGVEHRPRSDEEVLIMMFEPVSTINTGNIENNMTRKNPEKI